MLAPSTTAWRERWVRASFGTNASIRDSYPLPRGRQAMVPNAPVRTASRRALSSAAMTRPIKVVLFGATGMVGHAVLHECLQNPDVAEVLSVARRSKGIAHP